MTEKRFKLAYEKGNEAIFEDLDYPYSKRLTNKEVENLLNELVKEKDDWKNNCLKSVSENSILWNEIFILMEQGAEPSDAFKNYLNDLKNKNNKLQGVKQ